MSFLYALAGLLHEDEAVLEDDDGALPAAATQTTESTKQQFRQSSSEPASTRPRLISNRVSRR